MGFQALRAIFSDMAGFLSEPPNTDGNGLPGTARPGFRVLSVISRRWPPSKTGTRTAFRRSKLHAQKELRLESPDGVERLRPPRLARDHGAGAGRGWGRQAVVWDIPPSTAGDHGARLHRASLSSPCLVSLCDRKSCGPPACSLAEPGGRTQDPGKKRQKNCHRPWTSVPMFIFYTKVHFERAERIRRANARLWLVRGRRVPFR